MQLSTSSPTPSEVSLFVQDLDYIIGLDGSKRARLQLIERCCNFIQQHPTSAHAQAASYALDDALFLLTEGQRSEATTGSP